MSECRVDIFKVSTGIVSFSGLKCTSNVVYHDQFSVELTAQWHVPIRWVFCSDDQSFTSTG